MIRAISSALILILSLPSFCQTAPDFYISNQGQDYYPGTSPVLAKKTLTSLTNLLPVVAAKNGKVKIALKSGSTFNENIITSYPISVQTYADHFDSTGFAIMNGSKPFDTGWNIDSGQVYTYKQGIPYNGFKGYGIGGIGSYSYMYVFEINRELEKTAPFTARKLLQFVTSEAAVESTPGSFYSPINTNENPKQMYIHTSDGTSPNDNSIYRYEVTVMDWAINSTYQTGNSFENLWVRGFGAGNGMLPSGDSSYYNKIIFGPGAGVHHIGVRGGLINHSLFLPAARNTNSYAVVFYDVQGLKRHCTISNSIFLDIPQPLYAHTSYGINYGAVEMNHIVGFADTTQREEFMFTSNTDSVFLNDVYADGYSTGYNYGSAKYASITNSFFKDVTYGIAYSSKNTVAAIVKNIFIKTKGNYTTGIFMQPNTTLQLNNSIVHIKSSGNGSFINGNGASGSMIDATGNIFICDIDSDATLTAANVNTDNGLGTSKDRWDNNVYVLLKGNDIVWNISNAGTNGGKYYINDFNEWKRQSGQDAHSLFFDLRKDPRGLKAIFADADNGNYDWANTPEAAQIAALHAGMTDPLTCFLHEPSYEQAADIIKNNETLSVNTCRNPCKQNLIRVNNTLQLSAASLSQVHVKWIVGEQQNINYYELQRSKNNLLYERAGIIPVAGDSVYNFTDDVTPGTSYQYRLLVVAKAGNVCYSDTKNIKTAAAKKFILYPNPTNGKLFISMEGYLGKVKMTILNSNGQDVLQKEVFNISPNQSIDLTGEPAGVYFIKIETSEGIRVQKFVLQ